MNHQIGLHNRAAGCLLAGAAGDALGAPVEFMDRADILRRFGPAGIRDYVPAYEGIGKITDDTQMTLFTAEGCLRARHHAITHGVDDTTAFIGRAYQRWLLTQISAAPVRPDSTDSWLLHQPALFARRAPGTTCMSALSRKGAERNTSKGCGGVMRVAPCGILHPNESLQAFNLGSAAAKLTHGHPTGYLAAGVFAAVIAGLVAGKPLAKAIDAARRILIGFPDHQETLLAMDMAIRMAAHGELPHRAIPVLGEGWVAEEALGIALFCALIAENLEEGVIMAVNITGDSDSTGAMTGNLLGAFYGMAAIPRRWLEDLELREVIETAAGDLAAVAGPNSHPGEKGWLARYPAS